MPIIPTAIPHWHRHKLGDAASMRPVPMSKNSENPLGKYGEWSGRIEKRLNFNHISDRP
jgi:hypothetical protein